MTTIKRKRCDVRVLTFLALLKRTKNEFFKILKKVNSRGQKALPQGPGGKDYLRYVYEHFVQQKLGNPVKKTFKNVGKNS